MGIVSGLWFRYWGMKLSRKDYLEKSVDRFTSMHVLAKRDGNHLGAEYARINRALSYDALFRLNREIDYHIKYIEDLRVTAALISIEQSKHLWFQSRSLLCRALGVWAGFIEVPDTRTQILSEALTHSDALLDKISLAITNGTKKYIYESRRLIFVMRGEMLYGMRIIEQAINDKTLKYSVFEILDMRIEYFDLAASLTIQNGNSEQLKEAIGFYQKLQLNNFHNFRKYEAFKLLTRFAKLSLVIHNITHDIELLNVGRDKLRLAVSLSKKTSKVELDDAVNAKIDLLHFDLIIADDYRNADQIDRTIGRLLKMMSSENDALNLDVSHKLEQVMAKALLTRSKFRGGDVTDVADAKALIDKLRSVGASDNYLMSGDPIERSLDGEMQRLRSQKSLNVENINHPRRTSRAMGDGEALNIDEMFKVILGEISPKLLHVDSYDEENNLLPSITISESLIKYCERYLNRKVKAGLDPIKIVGIQAMLSTMKSAEEPRENSTTHMRLIFNAVDEKLDRDSRIRLKEVLKFPITEDQFRNPEIPDFIVKLYYYALEIERIGSNSEEILQLKVPFFFMIFEHRFLTQLIENYIKLNRFLDAKNEIPEALQTGKYFLGSAFGELSDYQNSEFHTDYAALCYRSGALNQRISDFDEARDHITEGLNLLKGNSDFHKWLGNRLKAINGEGNRYLLTADGEDWVYCANLFRSVIKSVPFEKYPTTWCRIQHERCWFLLNAPLNDLDDDLLVKSVAQLNLYYGNIHKLIHSISSASLRKKYIEEANSFGDILSLHYLRSNYLGIAVNAYNKIRGVRLATGLIETRLPKEDAGFVKECRLEWEKQVSELEVQSAKMIFDTHSINQENDNKETLNSSKTASAYRIYSDAIKATGLDFDFDLDIDELINSLSYGSLMCLTILTDIGSELILLGCIKEGVPIVHSIPLENANATDIENLLKGKSGWLATYRDYRDTYSSDSENKEEELQEKFSDCENKLQQISTTLGEALIQPLYDYLHEKGYWEEVDELLFVPNGTLSMLPLHAAKIKVGNDGGNYKYLIEDKAVSIWPTISALVHYSKKEKPKPVACYNALVVDAIEDSQPHIPNFFIRNKHIVSKRFDHTTPETFTKSAVLNALSKHYISYVYCHGHWNNENPDSSGLKMLSTETSNNQLLTVNDIRQQNMQDARLIFLGACETSMIGVDFLPNEFIGLPAAFMEAGLRCIVSSQWMVDGDYALEIADAFFEGLYGSDGESPAKALRSAILKISGIENKENNESDYGEMMFWAPFNIYGH